MKFLILSSPKMNYVHNPRLLRSLRNQFISFSHRGLPYCRLQELLGSSCGYKRTTVKGPLHRTAHSGPSVSRSRARCHTHVQADPRSISHLYDKSAFTLYIFGHVQEPSLQPSAMERLLSTSKILSIFQFRGSQGRRSICNE